MRIYNIYTYIDSYTYDNQGNLLNEVNKWDYSAGSPHGEFWRDVINYTYDNQSNLIERVFARDSDGDGVVDSRSVTSYAYDNRGNLLYELNEGEDGPGGRRKVTDYVYDKKNNLLESDFRSSNRRVVESYTYDDKGNQLEYVYETDSNVDGVVDRRLTTTRTYEKV